jgi:ATP-independent RNA helicase DbpA
MTQNCLAKLGFAEPTPIQLVAIPVLEEGKSLFALAPTGSGKTLAFLIPLMKKIDCSQCRTQLLVLTPTRELGSQIAQVAEKVAKVLGVAGGRGITVRTAFGGQKIEVQKQEMERQPDVVVATPGRALDLLQREYLKIDGLVAFVLDEADLMLGMGFEEQIADVCDFLPHRVQTALFSATEAELQTRLQNRLAHRAERVDVRVGRNDNTSQQEPRDGGGGNRHEYILVENHAAKNKHLTDFLKANDGAIASGVIFCQTRAGAAELCAHLRTSGFQAEELSGGLGQIERSTIMRRFKAKGVKYLIATNIAARGIDVSELSIVINYDLPSTPDEYIHRSGRSGRAGKTGWTMSLCLRNAREFFFDILGKNAIRPKQFVQSEVSESVALSEAQIDDALPAARFSKIHINKGKSSKIRPGDIVGVLVKQMGLSAGDVGNIYIFDHFTHVEVNADLATGVIEQLSVSKIKGMAVKASEARELVSARTRGVGK